MGRTVWQSPREGWARASCDKSLFHSSNGGGRLDPCPRPPAVPPPDANLLSELGRREAERFERRVWEALEDAPAGEERLAVALDWVVRLAREHPLLGRLPETGLVLTSLRERFPEIRAAFHRLLGPLLAESSLVRGGLVRVDELVGWMARVMVSTFLFPDPNPDEMAESLHAVWRRLAGPSRRARRR